MLILPLMLHVAHLRIMLYVNRKHINLVVVFLP